MEKIFAALLLVMIAGCGERAPMKIGFIGGTSGRYADFGVAGRNGAQLAIDQRNASGGIDGRSVVMIAEDDKQEPGTAVAGFNSLARAGVQAIVGPLTSSMAMSLVPLADANGLVMVSPTVTTSQLSGKDDNFFRVVADVTSFAEQMAKVLHNKRQVGQVVFLADSSNADYTRSWGKAFSTAFLALGGKAIKTLEFDSRYSRSYSELADQALAEKADVIILAASATDTAMLAQKIKQKSPAAHLASTGWGGTERLLQLGGKTVEDMVVEQYYDPNSSAPSYRHFRDAYFERFGEEPSYVATLGYDAASVVLDALAEQSAGQTLKEVLLKKKYFNGLQSEIVFDEYGDTFRAHNTEIVRNGRFQPLE